VTAVKDEAMKTGILTGLALIADKYGTFRQTNTCFIGMKEHSIPKVASNETAK
jgi:hypothetical protein